MARLTRLLGWALCLLWGLAANAQALAQPSAASAAAPSMIALAVPPDAAPPQAPARIVVMNREIATLRGSLFGIPAATRAAEGEARICAGCCASAAR